MITVVLKKVHWKNTSTMCMRKRHNTNAQHVILLLPIRIAWKLTSLQFMLDWNLTISARFMRERSHASAQFVITIVWKKVVWKGPLTCMENKSHKCTICDCATACKSSLSNHINYVHERKKPHKCTICIYATSQMSDLKRHISSVHERRKPYR